MEEEKRRPFVIVAVTVVLAAVALLLAWQMQQPEIAQDSAEHDTGEGSTDPRQQEAELSPVGGYLGSGVATRLYASPVFVHTVMAQLPTLDTDSFYEGWLVKPSPDGPQFFSTGRLQNTASAFVLLYQGEQDYSDYSKVVITKETAANGLDGIPEEHVLEGDF